MRICSRCFARIPGGLLLVILLILCSCQEVTHTPPAGSMEIAITRFSFGRMVVDGKRFESDLAIFADGRVERWHARINHSIELRDILALLDGPVSKLIIGVGTDRKCAVSDEIMTHAAARAIEVHILDTYEAVKLFNASEKQGLAACFHLTC